MKNKKLIIILIGALLLIIAILIYLLNFTPELPKYQIDSINVESNLINDSDLEEINKEIKNDEAVEVKDSKKMHQVLIEQQEALGNYEDSQKLPVYDEEGNELSEEELVAYAEETAISYDLEDKPFQDYKTSIEEVKEKGYTINIYKEDGLAIAKNVISPLKNLTLKIDEETPIIVRQNAYGDDCAMWVYKLYDNDENGQFVGGILVNTETGDTYGYSSMGIVVNIKNFPYEKDFVYNYLTEEIDPNDPKTKVPASRESIWKKIYETEELTDYVNNDLNVVIIDGKEYYKWTDKITNKSLLFDYWTGEQVVNIIK